VSYRQIIQVVDSHTAGDPLRLVVSGFPAVRGATIKDKVEFLNDNLSHLRKMIMLEPRGHDDLFGAILVEPTTTVADFGLIFFDTDTYYYGMCGHGTIAAATIIAESGMVKYQEPVTEVIFDTYCGLVKAAVRVSDNHATEVAFTNVPSFLYKSSIEIKIKEFGAVTVDIAYGGGFFILTPINEINLEIEDSTVRLLHSLAPHLRETVTEQISIEHPLLPDSNEEIDVFFYHPVKSREKTFKILEILCSSNQLTRSPCGTGTSALMAMLHGKGLLGINEIVITRGFLNTEFKGRLIEEKFEGNYRAVIPEIKGSAFITGFNQLVLHKNDPLGYGFKLPK
jgi:proline racemase